tara:strand:- start:947 stop:1945 length:999 start_codon:yes stop_codon:yes gene_type:complete
MKYFITGAAGFVGYHLAKNLLEKKHEVLGFDAVTSYYDVSLKNRRIENLKKYPNFFFEKKKLEDKKALTLTVSKFNPDIVFHLAAQAGVRYSLENPTAYINSNIVGTFNLLEILKEIDVKHFLFSSTSSVYGSNESLPFKENDSSTNQLSIYSSTKKSCESLIHSYSYSYKIPSTIFRFFTAYGPWGRPDMAMFIFTKAILEDKKINVYNHGEMSRDFTYINDLIESIFRLSNKIPHLEDSFKYDSLSNIAPYRIVNIGNSKKIKLMSMIEALERKLNKKSKKNFLPMQIGDIKETQADISLLKELTSYYPQTSIEDGVSKFIDWYLKYYQI